MTFTITTNARWLLSTTHKGRVYVFGHRVKMTPNVVDFLELGFRWPAYGATT